jgi:hypothetical protein
MRMNGVVLLDHLVSKPTFVLSFSSGRTKGDDCRRRNSSALCESLRSAAMHLLCALAALATAVAATPVLYDGRAPFNLTNADLNANIGPYLTYVCDYARKIQLADTTLLQWCQGQSERHSCML